MLNVPANTHAEIQVYREVLSFLQILSKDSSGCTPQRIDEAAAGVGFPGTSVRERTEL